VIYVTLGEPNDCVVKWRQIQKIEGRQNDVFIKEDGSDVPAGTILDILIVGCLILELIFKNSK